jgi:hypothetical protein
MNKKHTMEVAIIVLSIAVLGAVVLLVFMHNQNVMNTQAIAELNKEIDDLQEKRIEEIKSHSKANETSLLKLTEAAKMHSDSSRNIAEKISEAIEIMEGNQFQIIRKLDEIKR